ncbi:Uncharacterised protein [Mycobacterium tuberculosis]|nr:Uncharacterised protein [Mycobacterium tuberculosis]
MTAAACTTPRNWPPDCRAVSISFSATPGDATSPRTTTISARVCSSARTLHCSSVGSLRPPSTTRPAPRSTSQRATTRPRPPRPPVTTYDAPWRTTGCPLDTSIVARDSRSTNLRSPRHAITSSWRDPLPAFRSSALSAVSGSCVMSRSTRVVRMSGCSKASTRTSPFKEAAAGVPGSSSATESPPPVTSHSRGDRPCHVPTTARTTVVIDHTVSRAAASSSSSRLEAPPTNTTTPTGGCSGSPAVSANAASTADSSWISAGCTRRIGERHCCTKSSAIDLAWALPGASTVASASTSQLPRVVSAAGSGAGTAAIGLSVHSASKIFCSSGRGTARRSTRRR